jgi:hypothetical protein
MDPPLRSPLSHALKLSSSGKALFKLTARLQGDIQFFEGVLSESVLLNSTLHSFIGRELEILGEILHCVSNKKQTYQLRYTCYVSQAASFGEN